MGRSSTINAATIEDTRVAFETAQDIAIPVLIPIGY